MDEKSNFLKENRRSGNTKRFYPSDELNRKIAGEVEKAMVVSGYKDYQIAELLGITKQSYSVMKHKFSANMGNVEAVANALGYDIEISFVKRSSNG